jgi:hypothetical protein
MSLISINGTATNVTATGEDVVTVVQNATNISQLHDVDTNGASNGDLLIFNSSSGNWEDSTTLSAGINLDNNNIDAVNSLTEGSNGFVTIETSSSAIPLAIKSNAAAGEARFVTFSNTGANIQSAFRIGTDQNLSYLELYNFGDATAHTNGTTDVEMRLKGENAVVEASNQSGNFVSLTVKGNTILNEATTTVTLQGGVNLNLNDQDYEDKDTNTITRPYMKINGNWDNIYGPIGTTTMLGVANLTQIPIGGGNFLGNNWGFNAVNLLTEKGYEYVTFSAQEDGGNDNATHNGEIILRGDGTNKIKSYGIGTAGLFSKKQMQFEADTLNVETDSSSNYTVRPDYNTISGDVLNFVRRNAEDGTNDSDIADGSEAKFNFYVRSADETNGQLIGGLTGSTHSTDGNKFQITLDNQAQTDQVNAFEVQETKTTTAQPLQFPSFNSTDIGNMSPDNGWVLYNSTTNKLQVYADGSWVDLH